MTKAALVLALLAVPLAVHPTDPADGASVTSAQVSGLDVGRVGPELREGIARIAGGAFDRVGLTWEPAYLTIVRVVRHGSAVIARVLHRFLGSSLADDVALPAAATVTISRDRTGES